MSNKANTTMTPDNVIHLDISAVKTLQIGYQAESLFLYTTDEKQMVLKEYIGNTAFEYLAKVNSNRFKTTIRYGRREEVNTKSFVEIFLPKNWHGELLLYTQYGHISCQETIEAERFAAETSEGSITLHEIVAPRIRLVSSSNSVRLDQAKGFTDIHTTSGNIAAYNIDGGAKLETSTGAIDASFDALNNIVECGTLSGNIQITLPSSCGINVDGITKTGDISSAIEGIEIRLKPGNVKNVFGTRGEKPFHNIKLSTINGNIILC